MSPRYARATLATIACWAALCAVAIGANWQTGLAAHSSGQAGTGGGPSAPTGVTSACVSSIGSQVKLTWTAVPRASGYTIYDSTTSATTGYSLLATGATGTSWTSGSLSTGTYWFEVQAAIGTNWTSANSAATAQRTIAVLVCL